jgi:SAM-dependent methyltransferase
VTIRLARNVKVSHATWQQPCSAGDRGDPTLIPDCPVCGSARAVPVFPRKIPWLVKCVDCGLMSVMPQPTDDELADIYGGEYFAGFGCDAEFQGAYRAMKQRSATGLLELAERFVPPGKLLDVGSGLGDLLVAAERRGWRVRGLDVNPYAVELADELLPGQTVLTTLDEFQTAAASFDLIAALELIEHLRRPDVSLRRLFSWLRPGGVLLLTTPDAGSLASRVLRAGWWHLHRDHLWYFDRRTLTTLVHGAGFEVLRWQRARKVFNLQYVLSILGNNPNSRSLQSAARAGQRWLPAAWRSGLLPRLPEGQLLFARRPQG